MKAVALLLVLAVLGVQAHSPLQKLVQKRQPIPANLPTKIIRWPDLQDTPFPFSVCSGAPTDLNIQTVYVTPNPPVKGNNIAIQAQGTVDEQLTGGNFVINVLYMGVQIFSETLDLSKAVTLPVGPGPITLNYQVLIPSIAPSGGYTVQLTFNDQSGTEITCVQVAFTL